MATDAQHHRPVTLDQGRERRLGRLTTAGELVEQAAIRKGTQRPDVKERAHLLAESDRRIPVRHEPARPFVMCEPLARSYLY